MCQVSVNVFHTMLLSLSQYNLSWKKVTKYSDYIKIKWNYKIFNNKKDKHLN